ncbi:MAG: cytidylate kinase-like family protein [Lachnospira sp.]|uniref:Cytidylate kinase n=1 Tax=Lachnospira pectinoschiza TaxID=28052 RepID=A0A1G9XWM9_9FIRM|nr:cytidylate kinase-like family protein [Lachnospira pectinoschiza]MCR5516116.1 cytidylate kinase-like family protein [Lachnospira sp.]SDN00876.1 Cytidylate kinase [Lachnospira pectinoschiza]
MEKRVVITIGRRFGSGGHVVGELLATALQIPYYNNELINLAAKRGELDKKDMEKFDEKKSNPFLFEGNFAGNQYAPKGEPMEDVLFKLQSDVIKNIANKSDAVIIGRCADFVLEEKDGYLPEINVLSVFIDAPMEQRIERVKSYFDFDDDQASKLIKKRDKQRRAYYESHTKRKWASKESYEYFFDSSEMSINDIAREVKNIYDKMKKE